MMEICYFGFHLRSTLINGPCTRILNSRFSTKLLLTENQGTLWTTCFHLWPGIDSIPHPKYVLRYSNSVLAFLTPFISSLHISSSEWRIYPLGSLYFDPLLSPYFLTHSIIHFTPPLAHVYTLLRNWLFFFSLSISLPNQRSYILPFYKNSFI